MAKKRHPASRRRPPREEAPDDAFIAAVVDASAWAKRHSRALVLGVVAVVVLGSGAAYYRSYRAALRNQAVADLEAIHQTAEGGEVERAKEELRRFLARYRGSGYEVEARLLLAQLHLRTGDVQEAVNTLEPVARDPASRIEVQAAFLLAAAYEDASREPDAERLYLRIADATDIPFQRRDALAAAARLREARGDPAGAKELYDRILASLPPDSPERGLYQLRSAELAARLHTPAGP